MVRVQGEEFERTRRRLSVNAVLAQAVKLGGGFLWREVVWHVRGAAFEEPPVLHLPGPRQAKDAFFLWVRAIPAAVPGQPCFCPKAERRP